MPAASARSLPRSMVALRLFVAGLAVVLLVSLAALEAAPAEGRNLTPKITAMRSSQQSYEREMRTADRTIRQLKRARKQMQRKLKKTKRNLASARDRRTKMQDRLEDTRGELARARYALASTLVPPDVVPAAEPTAPTEATVGLRLQPADPVADPLENIAPDLQPVLPRPLAHVSQADVSRLEKQVKQQRKKAVKAGKKVRRVKRNMRKRQRQIGTIKRNRNGAIARRERAEAALGGRILAMASLAQLRANKATKVRPGRNSRFVWPVRGSISQTYGCTGFYLNPARGSCRHFHDGLDIVSYRGAPIRAAAVGVVSYIGWNPWDQRGRAFMVVVQHPGGYETLYGHVLPKRKVHVGQVVRRGQVIGYMGNTGRSTGVHLHFEMRRGRTTVNPLSYL